MHNDEIELPPTIIRRVTQADTPAVFRQILALAEYEKLLPMVTGTPETIENHLFAEDALAEAVLAEQDNYPAGISIFFCRYSPPHTRPVFYVEDLFVEPLYRRQGIGKSLLSYLAQLALGRNCARMEWMVLRWNAPAIAFYKSLDVEIVATDRVARITGEALAQLAIQPLPSIFLRDASPEDISALWELLSMKGAVQGSIEKLEENLFGFVPYVDAIVAEHGGRPIGMALFSRTYSTFLTAPGIFLEELFVLPDYRGYGLGKSFLISLAQRTIAMGGARLECYIDPSQERVIAYYQKLGAEILEDWRICRLESPGMRRLAIL